MVREKKKVVVSGNIGAGKSLVARLIASAFDFRLYNEIVNKGVLNDFYSNMKKHAYATQMYFLSTRYISFREMDIDNKSTVIDRHIDEDIEVFSYQLLKQGDMTQEEFDTLKFIRNSMTISLQPIDLLVFLDTSVNVLRNRIEKRIKLNPERENERILLNPNNKYLENLNRHYNNWFKNYQEPKIFIPTDKLILADEFGEAPFTFGDIPKTLQRIEDALYNGNGLTK